jgi:hypothetical protein
VRSFFVFSYSYVDQRKGLRHSSANCLWIAETASLCYSVIICDKHYISVEFCCYTLINIMIVFLFTQPRAMSCARLWASMTTSFTLECSSVLPLSLKCVCWNLLVNLECSSWYGSARCMLQMWVHSLMYVGRIMWYEELCDYVAYLVFLVKSQMLQWAGHLVWMGETNVYRILMEKPLIKWSLEQSRCRWKGNIKMDLTKWLWQCELDWTVTVTYVTLVWGVIVAG